MRFRISDLILPHTAPFSTYPEGARDFELKGVVLRALPAILLILTGCGVAPVGIPLAPDAQHCGETAGFDVYVDTIDCPTAAAYVERALTLGEAYAVWPADHAFKERLEFVRGMDLTAIGSPNTAETSVDGSNEMAVSDEHGDATPGLLFHEMIHAVYGDSGHCNWSVKYLRDLHAAGAVGGFDDYCANLWCDQSSGHCTTPR